MFRLHAPATFAALCLCSVAVACSADDEMERHAWTVRSGSEDTLRRPDMALEDASIWFDVEAPDATAPPPPAASDDLRGCPLEQLWFQPEVTHRTTPPYVGWSEDAGALVIGRTPLGVGASAWSARLGAPMSSSWNSTLALSRDWRRELNTSLDGRELRLVERGRGRLLWSRESLPGVSVLSEDGTMVASVGCFHAEGGGVKGTLLEVWDMERDERLYKEMLYEGECPYWTDFDTLLVRFTPDGDHLIVPIGQATGLTRFLLLSRQAKSEAFARREIELPVSATPSWSYERGLAGVASSPQSDRFYLVTRQGASFTIETSSAALTPRAARGVHVANWDTYLPLIGISPASWSGSGELFASVNALGEVELQAGLEGEVFASIAPPRIESFEGSPLPDRPINTPLAIQFSEDERAVAVVFRRGIGLWGCDDARQPVRSSKMQGVSVSAARDTLHQGETLPLEVTLEGEPAGELVTYTVLVDGAAQFGFFDASSVEISGYFIHSGASERTRAIVVEAHDGVNTVRSEPIEITVSPAP